jgi:tetratricopeptide (TPR) repeat protein
MTTKRDTKPNRKTDQPVTLETTSGPGRHYFVGRRDELKSLYEGVGAAATGRALQVFCVSGPAGIGKTRLGQELVAILQQGGKPVTIRSIDLSAAAGTPLLTQLLRMRFELDTVNSNDHQAAIDQVALSLGGIVHGDRLDDATRLLASLVGMGVDAEGKALPGFDPGTTRTQEFQQRAVKTAHNLLRYDTSRHPLLLILDGWDQAARPNDCEMAVSLVEALADRPVCLLVFGRKKTTKNHPLRCVPTEQFNSISLQPLGDGDVQRLVQGLLERVEALPNHAVATAVRQAGGSPLLALELVQLLAHREVVCPVDPAKRDGKWTFRPGSYQSESLPDDVNESVRERFEGLSPFRKLVTQAAAIQDNQFWVGATVSLLRTHPDVDSDAVFLTNDPVRLKAEGTIMSLVEEGFFDGVTDSLLLRHPALCFAVPTMKEHAYASISKKDRLRMHRVCAQWLQRTQGTDRLAWLQRVAYHLEQGGMGSDSAQRLVEAANLALGQNRPELAVTLLKRGLKQVKEDSAAVAAELLKRLGRIAMERGNYEEAEQSLMEEVRYATILDDRNRIAGAHGLLGQVLRHTGDYERSREHLQFAQALYTAEGDKAGLADIIEELGQLVWEQGDKGAYAQALEHMERATEMRRRLPHKRALARTVSNLARVQMSMGQLQQAQELHQEAFQIREQVNDQRGMMLSLLGLGAGQYECGDFDDAVISFERALESATHLGDRTYAAILMANIGEIRLHMGHLDESAQMVRDGVQLAQDLGNRRVEALGLIVQAQLDLTQGHQSDALDNAGKAKTIGYALENRHILGLALLGEARALSNTLFVAGTAPGHNEHMKRSLECFEKAIQYLEEMGERLDLCRALDAYGTFLVERGRREEGHSILQRAEDLRQHNRGQSRDSEKDICDQSTIRR